jgi:two-component system LytT family response regulator
MKKIVLIDDELNSLDIFEFELNEILPNAEILKCNDPRKAPVLLNQFKPDVVFLDIEMPWMNGFELLDHLEQINFKLVFVTAYDQYAVKAFQYFAIDYLLKPVDQKQLAQAIDRIKQQEKGKSDIKDMLTLLKNGTDQFRKFPLPTRNGFEFVDEKDIIRCEADSNYTTVFMSDGRKIVITRPLKFLANKLNTSVFFRPHQSHLINTNFMKRYDKSDGGEIILMDDSSIPLARTKKMDFISFIGEE